MASLYRLALKTSVWVQRVLLFFLRAECGPKMPPDARVPVAAFVDAFPPSALQGGFY